jgi:hypothetical protein
VLLFQIILGLLALGISTSQDVVYIVSERNNADQKLTDFLSTHECSKLLPSLTSPDPTARYACRVPSEAVLGSPFQRIGFKDEIEQFENKQRSFGIGVGLGTFHKRPTPASSKSMKEMMDLLSERIEKLWSPEPSVNAQLPARLNVFGSRNNNFPPIPKEDVHLQSDYNDTTRVPVLEVELKNIHRQVIKEENFWEKIQITLVVAAGSERYFLKCLVDGAYAPGIGDKAPADSEYGSFSPKFAVQWDQFQRELRLKLESVSSTKICPGN